MPYRSIKELPDNVKMLPDRAKRIFMNAFNASFDKGEESARKIAWSAVKRKFKKNEKGEWVLKEKVQSFKSEIVLQNYRIEAFTQDEILAMIDAETLDKIKQKDEHPFFQAYTMMHEGISKPRLLGDGYKKIHWTKQAVNSVKNIITKGVQFFVNHNKDNSTNKRDSLGEIVGDKVEEINGKSRHVIVGYFPPDTREEAKKYDVISQEANWNFIEQAGQLFADSIEKLTGIALGDSNYNKPAFREARRLGFVQAFENEGNNMNFDEIKKVITFDQIKQLVGERTIRPWQLFSENDMLDDRVFGKKLSEYDTTKAELDRIKEDIKKKDADIATLNKKAQLADIDTRIESILKEKQFTDKQLNYIKGVFQKNKENLDDLSTEGLTKFVDQQQSNYKEVMKYAGLEDDNLDNQPPTGSDSEDFTKAENNELLIEDL
jgi:cation transport regulator